MKRVVLFARSPEWRSVIERAEQLVESHQFRALKSEGRTRAGFLDVPGLGRAFLKRTEAPWWWNGAADRIRGSRAKRALRGAAMLKEAGFSCPAPIAAMDVYRGGVISASYLLSEAIERGDTLSRFALGPGRIKARDMRRRKRISDSVAREIRRLHEAELWTRDLQETNLMVEEDGAEGFKVYFLDLEDFRHVPSLPWRDRLLNLVHLDRSIGRFMSRSSRLDFLYAYLGGKPDRGSRRGIIAELMSMRASLDRPHPPTVAAQDVPARARIASPEASRDRA